MAFSREVQRLLIGLLVVFAVVALSATYWAVVGSDTLLQRDDNPRLFQERGFELRGAIVDRNGNLLAQSVVGANGQVVREYLVPAAYSAVGYYSLQYGAGGAEAAYDTILQGNSIADDWSSYFAYDILHRPRQGSDVQLTLDTAIQEAAVEAMEGRRGALVALLVPDGEVLALASLPTFDPNTLDTNWEALQADPNQSFFNRALQGRYQPGGVLQTPLLTAAILAGLPLTEPQGDADAPITVGSVELTCAQPPPSSRLTLSEAYAFACPAAFAQLVETLGKDTVMQTLDLFQLDNTYQLPGFLVQPTVAATATPVGETSVLAQALGQGNLTVTPLDMAVMTTAVINGGNAPQPNALLAVRSPESPNWQPATINRATTPITTEETTRQLQQLMRSATVLGSARAAARTEMSIGGHASLAYSGTSTQAWFIGYVLTGSNQGIAVALVLENEDDPSEAAAIGGQVLETAYRRFVGTQQP